MGNSNDAENLYTNVFDPGMLIGGALAGYAASPYEKPIPDVYRAVKTFAQEYSPKEVQSGFWRNMVNDVVSPNRSVVDAINSERYPLNTRIFTKTANALHSEAGQARDKSIDIIAGRLKRSPDRDPSASDALIDKSASTAKSRNIFIEPKYHEQYPNTSGIVTYDTGEPVIHYPLYVSKNSNIMHDPLHWRLGNITLYHEPVHVAQHDMYPTAFENGESRIYDWDLDDWVLNKDFVAYDVAKELGSYPSIERKYNGDVSLPYRKIPWTRR